MKLHLQLFALLLLLQLFGLGTARRILAHDKLREHVSEVSKAHAKADSAEGESFDASDESVNYLWKSRLQSSEGLNASLGDEGPTFKPWPWFGLISAQKKVLGEGAYGRATLHTVLGDGCKDVNAVVKTIRYNTVAQCDAISDEVSTMKKLRHPHIIGLYDYSPRSEPCSEEGGSVSLLLEAAMGGELEPAFNNSAGGRPQDRFFRAVFGGWTGDKPKRRERKFKLLKMLLYDLSDALAFMHKKRIVHRDIKPANIWKAEDSSDACVDSMSCRFVLGDFGLAINMDEQKETDRVLGTRWYFPPEQAEGQQWTEVGDVWALGASILQVMAGMKYWPHSVYFNETTSSTPLSDQIPEIKQTIGSKKYIGQAWKDLLFDMVETKEKRPSAEVVHARAKALLTPTEQEARDASATGNAHHCLDTLSKSLIRSDLL